MWTRVIEKNTGKQNHRNYSYKHKTNINKYLLFHVNVILFHIDYNYFECVKKN